MFTHFTVLGLKISIWGVCHAIAIFLIIVLPVNKLKNDSDKIGRLFLFAVMFGIPFCSLGAKSFSVLEKLFTLPSFDFTHFINNSGTTSFGAIVFGLLLIRISSSIFIIEKTRILDEFGVALPFAYCIGRVGCLISGDGCYGVSTDLPWGMSFPNGIVPTVNVVHPTPLYESVIMFSVGIIILLRRKHFLRGSIMFYVLLALSVERFFVEFIRINPKLWLLTQPQWISILFATYSIYNLTKETLKLNHFQLKNPAEVRRG